MTYRESIVRLVLTSVFAVSFVACSNSGDSNDNNNPGNPQGDSVVSEAVAPMTRMITIGSYKETCPGSAALCYIVKEEGKPWEIMSEPIENFSFAWGKAVTVEMEVQTITDPGVDSPTKIYRVQNVISEANEIPGSIFTMDLNRSYVDVSPECRFVMTNEVEFSANPDNCRLLNELLASGKRVIGTFRFTGNGEDPIALDLARDGSVMIPRFWSRVIWETWPAKGSGCNKTTTLTAYNDGRYEYRGCNGIASGQLHRDELLGISSHISNMNTNTDSSPKACEPGGENEAPKDLEIMFTNSEKLNVLRSGNEGICVRGTRDPAERLQRHMTAVTEKYAKVARQPRQ